MMPRQHIGSGRAWRYRRKRELCGCVKHARDGGVLPVTGFPRYGGMAIEEHAKTSLGHGANTGISYNTCIRSTDGVLGVIPSKRAFSGRIESVRCRGSRRSRNGHSGSSCTRSFGAILDESNVFGATVVEVVVLAMVVVRGLGGSSCSRTCSSWYTGLRATVDVHGNRSRT